MTNGQALRAIRLEHGLTQEQTAALLCVSTRTVERWEAGQKNCPPGVLKLAQMILNKGTNK
jgi:DNA-binding transcriptional regulator YiaG